MSHPEESSFVVSQTISQQEAEKILKKLTLTYDANCLKETLEELLLEWFCSESEFGQERRSKTVAHYMALCDMLDQVVILQKGGGNAN